MMLQRYENLQKKQKKSFKFAEKKLKNMFYNIKTEKK